MRNFKCFYYNIKYGVQNLVTWLPSIWKDRQWDYYYFYSLLNKKFNLMEKHFRKYGHFVGAEKVANIIAQIKEPVERLMKDDYYEDPLDGEGIDFSFGERGKFERRELSQEERDLIHKAFEEEARLKEKDKNLLFDLLKEHIDTFWD